MANLYDRGKAAAAADPAQPPRSLAVGDTFTLAGFQGTVLRLPWTETYAATLLVSPQGHLLGVHLDKAHVTRLVLESVSASTPAPAVEQQ
jgi:hypothetical protein